MQACSSVPDRRIAVAGDSAEPAHAIMRAGIVAASGAIFAAASALTAYLGYLWMFTGFRPYDDEGFMLGALRSFISGQALYDKVVLQYGPFFFELFGLLDALGVPFDLDSGRLVTLAVWVAIALLAGVAVFVFARNIALGLATQLITFGTLVTLTNEPMHPGGLVVLLLFGILAVALVSSGRPVRWPFFAIGALAAALLLTKINVGAFAAISIAFACVLTFPSLARNLPVRLVAAAVFVSIPFLLMRTELGEDWVRQYAIDVGLAALALVVATSTSLGDPRFRRLATAGWLFAGGAALVLIVLAAALLRGSSPGGLLHGIILNPLQQTGAFELPLRLPTSTLKWDLVSLGGAVLWTVYRLRARRPEVGIEGGIRILAGVLIWLTLLGGLHVPGLVDVSLSTQPLAVPLSLAWIVAAPRSGADGFEKLDFARALVASVAVLQALHAFPVAGSQLAFSAVFLVPAGAICISDGLIQLGQTQIRRQVASVLLLLAIGASWLPVTWQPTRAAYASSVPLGLPGASRVRVPAGQAALLREVTQSLRENCDTFISVPGLDSFYIFGQFQPPSPPTRWIWLANDVPQEKAVVEASNRIRRLCVIQNDDVMNVWLQGRPAPNGPLPAYIQSGFVPAYSFGPYAILVRRS